MECPASETRQGVSVIRHSSCPNTKKAGTQADTGFCDYIAASGLECLDNSHKVFAFQRCATNQAAVDVGFGEQFGSVRSLARATVKD